MASTAYYSKALEYAKEITVACSTKMNANTDGGKEVAAFFETVYNKIAELETAEIEAGKVVRRVSPD